MTGKQDRQQEIVTGPIFKTIVGLAVPVLLGLMMEVALSITDYFWVGKLGAAAQDAVTSSMVLIWSVFAATSVVTVGITAIVSRYVGSKDYRQVSFFIRQGLSLAVLMGVVFAAAGYLLTPALLAFMETGPETTALARPYLRIFFVSAPLFMLIDTGYAVFRASGDTRTPMAVGILAVTINMILDPALIFGFGPIPAMGVAGASLATGLAIAVGTVLIFWRLLSGKLSFPTERLLHLKPHFPSMAKIARIGLPVATQQFVFVFVYWFLIRFVHQFGVQAAAAMGIGNRLESISYLTCHGFSIAASTMVGQNLGAKQSSRAARCAWGATGAAVGATTITSVLFLTIPGFIASIFSNDPQVIAIARDYLIILGLSQTAMAVEIVLEGAFSGAGDTIPPMIVMIPGAAIRIPLAYYLAFTLGWGINGIWWTLTMTCIVKAAILAIWFATGRWKRKQL